MYPAGTARFLLFFDPSPVAIFAWMTRILEPGEFLSKAVSENLPLIDARSENEFAHASVPGSLNLPLLTNDHRRIVGTLYKQKGREAAILEGFRLSGPRFHGMLEFCSSNFKSRSVLVYCWRGGMRSGIMGWLLATMGFEVSLLRGGYKSFRKWTTQVFHRPLTLRVIGGPTGSGKTEVLNAMKKLGAQVLDLESIAHHRGSAFGGLGMPAQPTNEMFENEVAMALNRFNPDEPVWVENESRSIGSCILPQTLYTAIRTAVVVEMDVPVNERMQRIADEYGKFSVELLGEATLKLKKRMGPQHVQAAVQKLEAGDFTGWLEILLEYYDRLYEFGSIQRDPATRHNISFSGDSAEERARQILLLSDKLEQKSFSV